MLVDLEYSLPCFINPIAVVWLLLYYIYIQYCPSPFSLFGHICEGKYRDLPDLGNSLLILVTYAHSCQYVCIDFVYFCLNTVVILADSQSAYHFCTVRLDERLIQVVYL